MKKLIILCSLILVVSSCEKNDEPISGNEINVNNINLIAVTNVNNLAGWEQREAFNLLNPEEKVYLWQTKLDKLLKTKPFNDEQANVIMKMKEVLSTDLYNADKNISQIKINAIDKITPEIILNFSGDEIYSYFVNLHEDHNSNRSFGCECNKRDDWCISSYSCKSADCNQHSQGCGFLWSRACNGDCFIDTTHQ